MNELDAAYLKRDMKKDSANIVAMYAMTATVERIVEIASRRESTPDVMAISSKFGIATYDARA